MIKNPVVLLAIICLLYSSCSKSKQEDPLNSSRGSVNITLLSGSGQTDTIGRQLSNPVIFKVTQNGTPVVGYTVHFQASGCNQDNIISTTTQPDGTAAYSWVLSSEIGQQSLNAYAINSQNQKVDSVKTLATGLATGPGWHFSACSMQNGSPVIVFCKLSTGRLFTCYNGKTYLRYSDDNGISWNAVKTLGNTHVITYVLSSPTDELFAFTSGDGTFYSNDAGQTWSNLGVPPFDTKLISAAVCTPSGKLMVTADVQPPLCISLDKGKTWVSVGLDAFTPQNAPIFTNPTEDNAGNLYVLEGQNETVFKSGDVGKTWQPLEPGGKDCAFYIGSNNWFYKGSTDFNGGVYISKDNGVTFNQLIFYSNANIQNMSVQSDGNFYYENPPVGLYSAAGISSSVKEIFAFAAEQVPPYIVAKNNNILFAGAGIGYIEYYTK